MFAPGDVVTIHPNHPFYGGQVGVFDFLAGEEQEIGVFHHPRRIEEDPLVFFMIRPDDRRNADKRKLDQEREEFLAALEAGLESSAEAAVSGANPDPMTGDQLLSEEAGLPTDFAHTVYTTSPDWSPI